VFPGNWMNVPIRLRLMSEFQVGATHVVTLGHFVPGGHALAHVTGKTIFVRHGIPGEQVRIRITHSTRKVIRADVEEVLDASSDRVTAPCRHAGVCGGCDFQHIALRRQREIKSEILADALRRQGGLTDPELTSVPVEPVPGDAEGLRWRTRMGWHTDGDGNRGLYRKYSHELVPIDDCLLAVPGAAQAHPDDFWQAHRGLEPVLVQALMDLGSPQPGETWWDLYAGAGVFSRALAEVVGPSGRVDHVESSAISLQHLRGEIGHLPQLHLHHSTVREWLDHASAPNKIVVDPPRSGLGSEIVAALTSTGAERIISIGCDVVTWSRDLASFAEHSYRVERIRAFDAYPMTWNIEAVAALVPVETPHRLRLQQQGEGKNGAESE
jgi:tRNA/tmRNA/rRNA uracil-C5-methylase (TrmA/RlmC/RlmD family)